MRINGLRHMMYTTTTSLHHPLHPLGPLHRLRLPQTHLPTPPHLPIPRATQAGCSNRNSGIGALFMSLDDSDSDSDSEESPAPRSKNAALAAAFSSNSNSSSGTTPNAHRHNPFTNPQGQGQGQQQQQKQRQSRNPFETPPLQVQSRGPSGQPQMQQQQTQRTVLAASQPGYAAPIAALNPGQLAASAGSLPAPPQTSMTLIGAFASLPTLVLP
ncbi:hypothetical protein CPC08DRAFT_822437 [Agrocybe pediades]|nr:hypothetical protein CPC08DRAFT_822437 [Agrocybe pediades]